VPQTTLANVADLAERLEILELCLTASTPGNDVIHSKTDGAPLEGALLPVVHLNLFN
jgi:hypothetical protein